MNRKEAEKAGRRAEQIAAWWLRLKGYRILARRARTVVGEVDLIARRGRILAFIEVKARSSETDRIFALDEWRLRRVVAASEALAGRFQRKGDTLRIDAIFISPRRLPHHMTNVWMG